MEEGALSSRAARAAEPRWLRAAPLLVFVVATVLFLAWWSDLRAAQDRLVRARFEAAARRVATKITERLDSYDLMLRGAAGLFAASNEVSRGEFRRYVEELHLETRYRGVQGIGFAAIIPPGTLAAHEAAVRAEGFPGYAVHPAGEREITTSIVYLEPFSGRNLRAFGFDMFSEPVRRKAMAAARDGGDVATTGKVRLVQETEEDVQPGFLTYQPVYRGGRDPGTVEGRRAAIVGWTYSPMRMRDAMREILERESMPFRLEVFDGTGTGAENLLHDSAPGGPVRSTLVTVLTLPVNQHTWTLRFSAGPDYPEAAGARSPVVELVGVVVVALLLTGLTWAAVASWRARRREGDLTRSLRESEARWRNTFERAPVGIFVVAPDDRYLRVNERYCQITGFSREELLRMHWHDVVHPDDRALDREPIARLRAGQQAAARIERRGVRKDGAVFRAETTFSLETGQPGPASPVVCVLQDVTARHDAEVKFREIAERSVAGILLVQEDRITYANPAAAEICGRTAESMLRPAHALIEDLVHPEDVPAVQAARAHAEAHPARAPEPIAFRLLRPDGTVRKVTRLSRPITLAGRPATLVTLLDLTEQERTAEELRKTQRLESLGLLAGGIAHDFNNLLTAVFGHVEDARRRLDPAGEPARELDVALTALARSRDLTRQLLTFASGGAPALRLLDVPRLLEEAARLALGGSSIRARFEVEPGLPEVEADEGQLHQLLSNLLVNARQASPAGAEVVLSAARRTLADGEVSGLPAGPYVEIGVADRGHGIAPEVLPKVFDPLFTTRPSGTGLGLSMAYSIARRHGGHVSIESREGEGTRVSLLLPAVNGAEDAGRPGSPEAGSPAAGASPGPAASRPLRVLLMDDDPLVLRVGLKQLRRLGAVVDPAADGAEAVRLHRERLGTPDRYDLLVLDLTVTGGLGGAEALEQIRALEPGVVAVACSGYSGEGVMADPRRHGFAAALAKPYLAADLEAVLRAVAPPAGRGPPAV
ncbi:MAG TPA: CHASE domain-containing protein [Anaeromyxobacteraceae bacterium]|nr:CHASE domain-containing protein [Anaeromyxobacteraceae bacterium]